MKKTLCLLVIVCLLVFLLAGCAKIVSTETILVQAELVDVDYHPPYITYAGKVFIIHPANYDLIFEYNGIKYEFDVASNVYYRYENKIGQTFELSWVTNTYDDNSTKSFLEFAEANH